MLRIEIFLYYNQGIGFTTGTFNVMLKHGWQNQQYTAQNNKIAHVCSWENV